MATKSKLEQAVESGAAELNEAQRAIVLAQFSTYKRNCSRMADITAQIETISVVKASSREELGAKQAERSALAYEYNQLATANSRISAELFEQLGDKEGK